MLKSFTSHIQPLRSIVVKPSIVFPRFSQPTQQHLKTHFTKHSSIRPLATMADAFKGSEVPNKVRMMVLETDESHPETQGKGEFGDVLDSLFKSAGDAHDPPLGIETAMKFVVEPRGGRVPTVEELENVHAILITGSMLDATGEEEWILKLVKLLQDLWVHRPDIRFSGVCFGHQILCRMLGSKVEPTPGERWELAHTHVDLADVGKELFRTKEERLRLHQMHQDHVVNAPSSETTDLLDKDVKIHVWGKSSITGVQGIYIKDRMFTSQGHLGFDENMCKRQIQMRVDSGGIKDMDHAEAAKETAHLEHDGEVVAGAILRLFHGDDAGIP